MPVAGCRAGGSRLTRDHPTAMSSVTYEDSQLFLTLHGLARLRTRALLDAYVAQYGMAVQDGPFTGMILPRGTSWGDGETLPKLLGAYEAELHQVIRDGVAASPDSVINIGAAEGFYAIGLARLLPHAITIAYDSDANSQQVCSTAAALNDVADRVVIRGACTPESLQHDLAESARSLVICDCEGYELTLIDPAIVPALRRATLIIETHDFLHRGLTEALIARLAPTHTVSLGREGGRNPNEHPFLQGLHSIDRWLTMCEYRPETMQWIHAAPKQPA